MKKIDSLNLIPFIDIMLVLLVIVLTSASFVVQSRIQVDVPQIDQTQGQNTDKRETHSITINKEGDFFLDDKPLSLQEIGAQLEQLDKNIQVIIRGDRQSGLEFFLEITTMLRDKGINDVYVIAEQK
ncbi:biopolymer transporter ExbD [Helicobacter sp. MIT 03-1614]|jgi:biopolymer transport protein ExbD|uniref:Biopolymer transport protein n=1 Tax=Helicobacter hepaticus (strain ATCC 51449 / 3B1) TaxID=235279 RepID=Q7VJX3_HELHP|nr:MULTISPECIES: biopolymer transporter ExbD [Helicobacter]AAP76716.1 biopolymer transport protein [Helicobacter hepaticus ATCC 51449]TLD88441.1 biopolymer transporter ExbD [Helicobacter sp. MIT 03-1614]